MDEQGDCEKIQTEERSIQMWKMGQTTWEKDTDVVRVCRDVTRKAKASLEFNLTRSVKDKKGFFT